MIVVMGSWGREWPARGEISGGDEWVGGAGGMDRDAVASHARAEPLPGALGQDGIESEREQRMIVAMMIVQ